MNDNLLTQYISRFAGYGNLDGDYWMIGMEEGGGDTVEEIERRVTVWEENGKNQLEDLKQYHDRIGVMRWFTNQAKLQPTWNKLIRIVFGIKRFSPQTDDVRDYQSTQFLSLLCTACLERKMPRMFNRLRRNRFDLKLNAIEALQFMDYLKKVGRQGAPIG